MEELHKVRENLTKQWHGKSKEDILKEINHLAKEYENKHLASTGRHAHR